MLDGQVQIGHHLVVAHHGGDEGVRDALRVGVQHPDPVQAVDFVQLVQQVAHRAGLAPVLTVGGGILRHQNQLFDAFPCQPAGLGHAVRQRAGAQRPPDERNGTVVTSVVAALGDFQVGVVPRRGNDPRTAQRHVPLGAVAFQLARPGGAQPRHDGGQRRVGADAHHSVHFGHFRNDLLLVPLGQTAGDDDLQIRVLLLVLAGHEDVFDGLAFGGFDETAGVDDDNVCLGQIRHRLVAFLQQRVAEYIGVHLILGTAEGNNGNVH